MAGNFLLDMMICRIPALKGKERINLAEAFDNEDDFSILSKKDISGFLERDLKGREWTMPEIRKMAEKDVSLTSRLNINFVSWRDNSYPPLLREIYDPPAMLFYRGTLPDPEKPLVAVVGTRKPSAKAAERAYCLGRELGEAGLPVISGLALGIDSMAHRGNMDGHSFTIAVLGSGPDNIYPVSNRDLARRILETGGLILSEYPPGTGPLKGNFPARNRIISAMARGTVIVEAPEKSGALITARFALEHGRDLWVDKVGVGSSQGAGTKRLVVDGAPLIDSVDTILADWNLAKTEAKIKNEQDSGADAASVVADYLKIKL